MDFSTAQKGSGFDTAEPHGTSKSPEVTSRTVYYPQNSDEIEDIEQYRPGGYHPVELGDVLHNGQYHVLHKLGHGGFSTVWLAQDTVRREYVAIKIIISEASAEGSNIVETIQREREPSSACFGEFISYPTATFWIDGPNGRHFSIVSPLAGPNVAQLVEATRNGTVDKKYMLEPKVAQRLALQVTQAMAALHNSGSGHGDLTCPNILLELRSLDHLTPHEIRELLGHSRLEEIARIDGKSAKPTAPEYAIEPADTLKLLPFWTGNIKVADFQSSYKLDDPPEDLDTPWSSCSPEYMFSSKVGKESDIWALGVAIFQMRSGKELFPEILGGDMEVTLQMVDVLGPMPYNLVESIFGPDKDNYCIIAKTATEPTLPDIVHSINFGDGPGNQENRKMEVGEGLEVPSKHEQQVEEETRHSKELPKQEQQDEDKKSGMEGIESCAESVNEDISSKISKKEADLFLDLLNGALNYDVEKRLSADEMLRHPWFSKNF
ncbi:hypothetical protein EG329_011653 [Mollisiaceae sp. DMI_Dod_QoI]|nr:hypothetical protein EG329_011653 [Helotiales sp. DMI_Dod_QoI]